MTMIRPRSDVVYGIYRGLPSGDEVPNSSEFLATVCQRTFDWILKGHEEMTLNGVSSDPCVAMYLSGTKDLILIRLLLIPSKTKVYV